MSPERTPTETSPLLGSQSENAPINGAITNDILRDPEADPSKDDLAPRHNLRYILPAVSLGVGLMSYNSNITVADAAGNRSSCLQPIRRSLWPVTGRSVPT
jgi:hypothetical protein